MIEPGTPLHERQVPSGASYPEPSQLRVAVVTPYWGATPAQLRHCHESVRAQTLAATHFLVADGQPLPPPDGERIIHVPLPRHVGGTGAAARGIGAMLAFRMGFDAVAFLDHDNWYDPDHLRRAIVVLERHRLDLVFARRRVVFADGEELLEADPEDDSGRHVDSNCWIISRRAAFLAATWALHPRVFGSGEDRLPLMVARMQKLRAKSLAMPTVWYETHWPVHHGLGRKQPVAPLRRPAAFVRDRFDPEVYRRHTGWQLPARAGAEAGKARARPELPWRVAVVTPWRGESTDLMLDCLRQVRAQGLQTQHLWIGDGCTPVPDSEPGDVLCWCLPINHDPDGCFARGVGALLAFKLDFDAVAFIDPGTRWDPQHLSRLVKAMESSGSDVVVARSARGPGLHQDMAAVRSDLANAGLIGSQAMFVGVSWAQLPDMPSIRHAQSLLLRLAAAGGASVASVPFVSAWRSAEAGQDPTDPDAATSTRSHTFSATSLFAATGRRSLDP